MCYLTTAPTLCFAYLLSTSRAPTVSLNFPECVSLPMGVPKLTSLSRAICSTQSQDVVQLLGLGTTGLATFGADVATDDIKTLNA